MTLGNSKNALVQLCIWRLREFGRRPEALFWTYGFPFIMLLALGFAFRESKVMPLPIEVIGPRAQEVISQLKAATDVEVKTFDDDLWRKRLQSGVVNAIVETEADTNAFTVWAEESRAESRTARWIVESKLRMPTTSSTTIGSKKLDVPGQRYIDFLVPGMLAMNLMGGGLWGIGFSIVDLRVRKLLKRFLATPMSRNDFMTSIMIVRVIFAVCELTALMLFGYFVFDVVCQGSYFDLIVIFILGGVTFVGVGLLISSRVQTIEAISGLMNLVMVPMWIVGGVFFSNERFPDAVQPILKALPFVALVDSIRGIMLEGMTLTDLWQPIIVMIAWAIACFAIAIKIFRWK
jgi:ABC-2 type transport system permease protein